MDEQDLQAMKEELLEEIEENQAFSHRNLEGMENSPRISSLSKHPLLEIQRQSPMLLLKRSINSIEKNYHPQRIAVIIIGNIDVERVKSTD